MISEASLLLKDELSIEEGCDMLDTFYEYMAGMAGVPLVLKVFLLPELFS